MAAVTDSLTRIPFLDLGEMHRPIKEQILDDVSALIDAGAFTNGPAVAEFEKSFASYCGTKLCVGTGSGLDALRIALVALGVGPGDEVIVPALTFVATLEAVTQAGALPVLADVDDTDMTLSPEAAAAAISPRTRAVMPVHLYGQMADMLRLNDMARPHELLVVEDACQAHGALRAGVRAGAAGNVAAFSFYPAKNLGALGDAGAATTDDADLADAMRALREHGQRAKYMHEREGYTARLDTIHALVLSRKLPRLDGWNDQRRAAAAFYLEALRDVGDLQLPVVSPESEPVWHLFTVRTSEPEQLAEHLAARGVGSGRHYPVPPHLTGAYGHLGYAVGSFPVAERVAAETLSLPLFPGITAAQLEAVVGAVSDFF